MEQDRTSAQQVQDAFTRLMRWAHRGDVRRSLLGAAAHALSPNDVILLRTITAHGPVRVSDLASWQRVDKSTVTPQVRRLEDRGLVARQGDPGDKRAALLTTTDHGHRTLRDIDQAGVHLFDNALDSWPDPDRRALAALMQRFVDHLADVPQPSPLPPTKHRPSSGEGAS
ncbi:MarR family winged helix-turn-helix transcriptional regulator [Jidongwangia harbinensis]|uniref:MarR family winged helix-turn-helix transcriptional regulator n=1 Tax=Jidongwangia harbinensis TaxID=2878561 RepID=UPI001CD97955|nr:MarR family transcriptional regulator [Jidongwangia harbinensis]MCA2218869.1 MarR family transcriptional regulator [Jidongwangia harbinensis]